MERIYKDESANKGGIYKITNKINGKIYIGSTVRFRTRWDQHQKSLERNKHGNRHLQSAWNIHGTDNFLFEVIEIITGTKEERINAEQVVLDQIWDGGVNCYNVRKDAQSTQCSAPKKFDKLILVDPDNKEHKIESWLSDFAIQHKLDYMGLYNVVTKRSKSAQGWRLLENKDYIFDRTKVLERNPKFTNKGMTFGPHSPETIEKIRLKVIERQMPHKDKTLIAPDGKIYTNLINMKEFCKTHNLSESTISSVLNDKRNSHKGWRLLENKDKVYQAWNKGKLSELRGMNHPRAKIYENIKLQSPDGTIYTRIECLSEFCRTHNLSNKKMPSVLSGKRHSHKGWRLL